ncbi:carbonic anhydrase [Psychromicrobium silvestre]|uniref:carbonic anhydrase n=1 Tax=Psychromicrobium silvestre TaxID=1645614 RepID=A0A7Y9LVT6_9MICC|nr:carbonic anhydrase [Psychromicrobium silvestre]NYE96535.1 carbonic anhydrase [Psychromicrobium silvestre]
MSGLTPEQAWLRLRAGNERFINGTSQHPNQDSSHRESLVRQQNPFAVIFGCSDSRLAAEIIFDLGLGDAFVVRTAGQVIDLAVLGSIEYSVAALGVPLIVVLGHDNCGAITATKEAVDTGEMPRGYLRNLVERITPSVLASRRDGGQGVNDYMVEHIKQTSARLVETSRVVAEAVEKQQVAVVGLAYRLNEGRAELVSSLGSI